MTSPPGGRRLPHHEFARQLGGAPGILWQLLLPGLARWLCTNSKLSERYNGCICHCCNSNELHLLLLSWHNSLFSSIS